MRILHVGKYYPPIPGGIESVCRFVVESLPYDEHRVISFNNRSVTVHDHVDNVQVVRAATWCELASQPLSWAYYTEIKRQIRTFKPDVIYFHYPNPLGTLYLLLSIPKRCRLIVHWHSDIVAQRFIYTLIKGIERRLLSRASRIIATSPSYAAASHPLSPYKDKIEIIPCAIDTAKFDLRKGDEQQISQIKKRYGNAPIVYFVGRHVEYKGLRYLLEAEKSIKQDCTLLIAGTGPLTQSLQARYSSERIHWLGRLSDDEMRWYYHAADIFAFPSITRNEAFGIALAESMYCNCPSVTFTIPASGVNWVSPNGISSIEVPNSDASLFADAIDTLLSDRSLYETLANGARKRVMTLFSKDIITQKYRELMRTLIMND